MKTKLHKLNVGCGEHKLEGYINIDLEKKVKPDLHLDVRSTVLPFKENSIDQINCIHNLEHIELKYWPFVLGQFHKVLKLKGRLILAYPEFERCAKNFLTNYRGMRDFWRATLYGRQLYRGDYHVVPMHTKDIIHELTIIGFDNFKFGPEIDEPHNTFLTCQKITPLRRADVVKKEVFGK